MEDFVRDLPYVIGLEEGEDVGESEPRPVFELKAYGSHGVDEVNACNAGLKIFSGSVRTIPDKKLLNWPGEHFCARIAEDSRIRVEGGFHRVGLAGPGTVDI